MDKFVLYENQLIDVKHYPVCMVINSVSEMDFPYLIQCLSEGESYGNNGGGFSTWDSFDEYDKNQILKFEGFEFESCMGESVIISYKDVFCYMNISCKSYIERHPDKNIILYKYLSDYKIKYNL